jgi:DNA-binding response OmpR family regulator
MPVRILVVEDDHRLARGLVTALTRAGFAVSG